MWSPARSNDRNPVLMIDSVSLRRLLATKMFERQMDRRMTKISGPFPAMVRISLAPDTSLRAKAFGSLYYFIFFSIPFFTFLCNAQL